MKVLVIGSGGREHALAWKLAQSPEVKKVYIAPGNGGTLLEGENVPIASEDIPGLKDFAAEKNIDLTVVGPELPLTMGIVDEFRKAGLRIFGPSKQAAEIEGSKAFSKDFMLRHNIPTASYRKFTEKEQARKFIAEQGGKPLVVKASGLAAGKGVVVCRGEEEALEAIERMMAERVFGEAGSTVVIEEFLEGEEASFLAITDGKTVLPLAPAQDHKAIFDGDRGPNTGGMGAFSPTPLVTPELENEIMGSVMTPAVRGMGSEGRFYTGVLYAGLMISSGSVKVLEFNSRFGDPETQPMLMRLENDLFPVLMAAADGKLEGVKLRWSGKTSVCVVMAARGYPGPYEKGAEIRGLDEAGKMADVVVFHAGTSARDSRVLTAGGRVVGVTGLGETVKEAREKTYRAVEQISWEGAHYRKDIGMKALQQ